MACRRSPRSRLGDPLNDQETERCQSLQGTKSKYRVALTSWQDDEALEAMRMISAKTGISQQALIAEGLNYVLAKYRKRTVAK
jgi:hypothetical protein